MFMDQLRKQQKSGKQQISKSDATDLDRRRLLAALGTTGAITALTGSLAGCSSGPALMLPPTTPTVLDILNFALNLEYLEATFYSYVTTGAGLAAADLGTGPGTVTGGAQVTFTSPIVASAAAQLAADEREHVEFLRATISSLGGTPVQLPDINLAATGAVNSDATFLAVARQLEDVGVSAYIGGAQYLTSNIAALDYAAQILDTEAQHSGFIRELCITYGVTSPAADSQDNPPTATQIFDTSTTTGLAPVRTTSQVLQITFAAVGSLNVNHGGFFPSGIHGNIAIT